MSFLLQMEKTNPKTGVLLGLVDSDAHEVSHDGEQLWPDAKGEAAWLIANDGRATGSTLRCFALRLFGELTSKANRHKISGLNPRTLNYRAPANRIYHPASRNR